jgi:FG-GAP-like repeat
MSFATFRIPIIAAFVLLGAGAMASADAAGTHELVLYRPATSTFYIRQEPGDAPAAELPFGAPGDIPFYADFTGDGKREPILYRKGQWLISTHGDGNPDITVNFGGQAGEIPVVGDVDGDGKADLVLFRSGVWYVRPTGRPATTQVFHFGAAGDVPLLGDLNGDGKIDFAVFRAGHWFVDTNRDGKPKLEFGFGGVAGERTLTVDWDGHVAPALFRDGSWLISADHDGKVSAQAAFGTKGDIPVAAWTIK